jgi:hypothetical protein
VKKVLKISLLIFAVSLSLFRPEKGKDTLLPATVLPDNNPQSSLLISAPDRSDNYYLPPQVVASVAPQVNQPVPTLKNYFNKISLVRLSSGLKHLDNNFKHLYSFVTIYLSLPKSEIGFPFNFFW